jgi:hypothetical protein
MLKNYVQCQQDNKLLVLFAYIQFQASWLKLAQVVLDYMESG